MFQVVLNKYAFSPVTNFVLNFEGQMWVGKSCDAQRTSRATKKVDK